MMDFGMPQLDAQGPLAPPLNIPAPKKRGGLFGAGKGNIAEAISAAIGGWLMGGGNPAGANILGMLQQRRQQKLEEDQYQRRRQDALADYGEKQKLEAQYGRAAQPHYFEDNSGNQWAIGPDGQPQLVYKDPLQFKFVPNGMGGVQAINIQQLMSQMGGGQEEILDALPPGAKPLGGPTPQASGGFPRPY
jgi:hypothetical protein